MRRRTAVHVARAKGLPLVFTLAEARAAGLTRDHLRGPGVALVFRGVYTTGNPADLAVRARAALKLAVPDALVCETTGLALLGVELPDEKLASTVHIWVPSGVGPRMAGIRSHRGRLHAPLKRVFSGVTSVDPAECWFQCAATLSVRDLVILADGLMRRQDPVLCLDDLRAVLARSAGQRGIRAARRALELAREGTDSPMETLLRLILVEAGLPCPAVNLPIILSGGTLTHLDMAYVPEMVAVEYDGADHVTDVVQMRRDQTRRRRIEDLGWRLITGTYADITDSVGYVESVRQALAKRSGGG